MIDASICRPVTALHENYATSIGAIQGKSVEAKLFALI